MNGNDDMASPNTLQRSDSTRKRKAQEALSPEDDVEMLKEKVRILTERVDKNEEDTSYVAGEVWSLKGKVERIEQNGRKYNRIIKGYVHDHQYRGKEREEKVHFKTLLKEGLKLKQPTVDRIMNSLSSIHWLNNGTVSKRKNEGSTMIVRILDQELLDTIDKNARNLKSYRYKSPGGSNNYVSIGYDQTSAQRAEESLILRARAIILKLKLGTKEDTKKMSNAKGHFLVFKGTKYPSNSDFIKDVITRDETEKDPNAENVNPENDDQNVAMDAH